MYSISEYAGLLVKQAREEKQWDQQYLADELDIDIRTLKKIEAGKSDIPFDILSNLIHLLEISPKSCSMRSAQKPAWRWIRYFVS